VAKGMEEYLWQNRILFKDYQDHVKRVSEHLKKASLEPFVGETELQICWRAIGVQRTQQVPRLTQYHEHVAHVYMKDRKLTGATVPSGQGDVPIMETSTSIRNRKGRTC
jgi:hypothetical protein